MALWLCWGNQPSHTTFYSCTSRKSTLTADPQHFYSLAWPKVSGKISLDTTFPVSSGILWRSAFVLIRKGVDIFVFLWKTVTHLFLSKIEVSKIEVKEGGEQTSVSSLVSNEKWVTDLNWLSQGEGTSTAELKHLQSHRIWSSATPTDIYFCYFRIDSPQFGRISKAFGICATPLMFFNRIGSLLLRW